MRYHEAQAEWGGPTELTGRAGILTDRCDSGLTPGSGITQTEVFKEWRVKTTKGSVEKTWASLRSTKPLQALDFASVKWGEVYMLFRI